MKNVFSLLAFILLYSTSIYATPEKYSVDDVSPLFQKDKQVSLTHYFINNTAYFNLRMLNETKGGIYTMLRVYEDGKKEVVESKYITINTIDSPLLYSFVDKEVPKQDFLYVLTRTTDIIEDVGRWSYCSNEQILCPESIVTLH